MRKKVKREREREKYIRRVIIVRIYIYNKILDLLDIRYYIYAL